MLTLTELKELLVLNEILTVKEMRGSKVHSIRLYELTLHRNMLKDTIIEVLEKELFSQRGLMKEPA